MKRTSATAGAVAISTLISTAGLLAGTPAQAATTNLVANASFANGTSGWSAGTNTAFTVDKNGYQSTKGATLTAITAGKVALEHTGPAVDATTAHAAYVASVRVKNPSTNRSIAGSVSLTGAATGSTLTAATPFTLSDTAWHTVKVSGTPAGTHGLDIGLTATGLVAGQSLLVDDFKVVQTDPPAAHFTAATTFLKASLDATASADPDGTIASYAWDFGDGTTGTGKVPTHTYATPGTKTVTLTTTDNVGAVHTVAKTVTVVANNPPVASFSVATNYLTAKLDASASSDSDGTIASRTWDFGDGTTGSGTILSHTYATAGSKTVTLAVKDNSGATTTTTRTVMVAANLAPRAAFEATHSFLTAKFDASATTDTDGTVSTYAWNFGDGTTGTGKLPSHTYTTAGTKTVTLTVTDNAGAKHSTSKTVTVVANNPPVGSFTASTTYLVAKFDASASTDSDGTISAKTWDFGDGTTGSGNVVSRTYATAGPKTVSLTVKDNSGATHTVTKTVTVVENIAPTADFTTTTSYTTAKFNAAGSSDSDGTITARTWTFGDGTTGSGSNLSHTYANAGTYTVALTVKDDGGKTDTMTTQVTVVANQAPTAAFSSSTSYLTATLDASASADADGTVTAYAWSFGNGTTGSGKKPVVTYTAAGTYQVKLTVTDNGGASTSRTVPVIVVANKAPTAAFTTSSGGRTARFDAAASSDPEGKLVSWSWSYGDGTTGAGSMAAHTYPTAGTRTVTLTVTDEAGATATAQKSVTVVKGPDIGLGVYNGSPSELPDEATIADFGGVPDVASSYYTAGQNLKMSYETARIRRGTSPNLTMTTKGTQLLAGIANGDPDAIAFLDAYVGQLATLAAVDPTVPVYAALEHEFRAKVKQGLVTGPSADIAVYAKALSLLIAKAHAASPNIQVAYWMVGYDRAFEGAVGSDLTERPDVITFDPYANGGSDTITSICTADLSWIRSQPWYDDQPIALSEFGMPVKNGDAALARFYTNVRPQLDALGLSWAVFFNRPTDNDHEITTATNAYPNAVRAFSASLPR